MAKRAAITVSYPATEQAEVTALLIWARQWFQVDSDALAILHALRWIKRAAGGGS